MSANPPENPPTPLECTDCGTITFVASEERSPCCDRPVRTIDVEDYPVEPPSLEELLGTVFGMSRTELDVCLCVMDVGEATTNEIADELDVDRSHVSRHLNHLVDLGVLEKNQRILERGGRVNVYTPSSLETVRRNFTIGLFAWMTEAVDVVSEVSREKVESIAELDDEGTGTTIYHDVDDGEE